YPGLWSIKDGFQSISELVWPERMGHQSQHQGPLGERRIRVCGQHQRLDRKLAITPGLSDRCIDSAHSVENLPAAVRTVAALEIPSGYIPWHRVSEQGRASSLLRRLIDLGRPSVLAPDPDTSIDPNPGERI